MATTDTTHAHAAETAAAAAHPSGPVVGPRDGANSPSGDSAPLEVLVVGAGQSGLSMAWHLARRGVRYLLIDAAPEGSGTPGGPGGTR